MPTQTQDFSGLGKVFENFGRQILEKEDEKEKHYENDN
jgi:hypothetical protein